MRSHTRSISQFFLAVIVVFVAVLSLISSDKEMTLGGTTAYAIVSRVIDGDTIELDTGQVVRYIGVDTPETTGTPECWAREAQRFNTHLVLNKEVRLEKDVSEADRYGRLLRYVYVDDIFVNAELVEEGYATVATFPPDVAYKETFRLLQEQAREKERGLWGGCEN